MDLLSDIKSLKPLFEPQSIAVIGASPNYMKPSGQPVSSLVESGYAGAIYPVNPNYEEIKGLKCYPDLTSIPGEVDMAIIAVGAALTLDALRSCMDKGVKGAVVLTSGFGEVGGEGTEMQKEMTRIAQESGMRICGPNCMGIFSYPNRLMAGFALTELAHNKLIPEFLGFVTQSGGFGHSIYDLCREVGIGFTHFVSTGNEADVEFSEYLAYIAQDNITKVIGGYLEGVKDGRKLLQAAELAMQAGKPVALIKTGRYPGAARAAASHTGSMVGSDRVYSAFFKQKGIVRLESVEEAMVFYSLMATGKLPMGKRVGVISASGGGGVLLADKCEGVGLTVTPFTADTVAKLVSVLPSFAGTSNPVDITSAMMTQPGLFRICVDIVTNDPNVDSLVMFYMGREEDDLHDELADICAKSSKPIVAVTWGPDDETHAVYKQLTKRKIPVSRQVDTGVRALASVAEYAGKLAAFRSRVVEPPIVSADAKEKVEKIIAGFTAGQKLTEYQSKKILAAYGIPVTREELATTPDEAVRIAGSIGYPVVAKIESPDILHKTDAGGVKLNLDGEDKVRAAYAEITTNARNYKADADIRGVLIQEMVPGGTEVIVGMATDLAFGPTVLFGLGGIFVEALEDVSIKVAPLSRADAQEMLEEIRGRKVLDGLRGKPPADKQAIVDTILRISQLVMDFPQLAELDINPLLVFADGQGAKAADALLVLK
ncbi:MAG: acetate--CoA ligase family protein [Bacillota bacterium]